MLEGPVLGDTYKGMRETTTKWVWLEQRMREDRKKGRKEGR